MTDRIAIAPHEKGVLRLFAIDLPPGEARAYLRDFDEAGPDALATALGVPALNPDYVEVFAADDIAELGLSSYLVEGYGISDPDLTEQAAALDMMEGYFAVIVSAAFQGEAHDLAVGAPLRLVATYREPLGVPAMAPISSASATGTLAGGPATATARRKIPTLAILVAVALVLLVVALVFLSGGGE